MTLSTIKDSALKLGSVRTHTPILLYRVNRETMYRLIEELEQSRLTFATRDEYSIVFRIENIVVEINIEK